MKRMIILLLSITAIITISGCNSDNNTSQKTFSSSSTNSYDSTSSENITETTDDGLTVIDPFEGLEVQFDGISPYINIGFNNSKCTKEVQDYVEFTYEEGNIANGDSVTITAEYNINDLTPLGVKIENDEKEYTVSGCPEYVNDISTIDTSVLDKEIQEYMDAHYLDHWNDSDVHGIMSADVNKVSGGGSFNGLVNQSIDKIYLCARKPNKLDESEDYNYYYKVYNNCYSVIDGDLGEGEHQFSVYACIYVKNIISYPDGTLKYDPELGHNANISKESAFYDGISVKKEDYNVSEVKNKSKNNS